MMERSESKPKGHTRPPVLPPKPVYCSSLVTAALAQIQTDTAKIAKLSAPDASVKASVASPKIAPLQAEITRLQSEANLTRSFRFPWVIDGKPGASRYTETYQLYEKDIQSWLSNEGVQWFTNNPGRVATLAIVPPLVAQLDLFPTVPAKPLGSGGGANSSPPSDDSQGIVIRDPAQGMLRLCRGRCADLTVDQADDASDIATPAPVVVGQLGRRVILHLKNRMFENSTLSLSLNADGSIASLGNHTTGTLAAGLSGAGDVADAATNGIASYNTAVAARNSNTLANASLTATLNQDRANCFTQQQAVRAAGGVPIGTCD